jgi:ABC-type phosphate/phosphonate transport system substrate-binding protein
MYDFAPLGVANDALWASLARSLGAAGLPGVPEALDRARPLDAIWADPALLLAQTCGWPLMTSLAGRVTLIATPHYELPGCDGPYHRSFVVVRTDDPARDLRDLRGRQLALNLWDSNSGMNLLRALVAPLAEDGRFFGAIELTGGHVNSLAAVADGRADAACIDCVTFGLLARHRPDAVAPVRVLAETQPSPSLPFITRQDAPTDEVAALRAALAEALDSAAVAPLAISGISELTLADYQVLPDMASQAERTGYATLA